jgi:hypothetical protein
MEAKHMMLLYYCETHWLSYAKGLHRVFELKKEQPFFKVTGITMVMQIYVTMKIFFRDWPIQ